MATGLVPVVYWVPGPFSRPNPRQPDKRGTSFLPVPVPCLARGGWLRAPPPWHSPDLIGLPAWLASPVLD